MAGGSLKEISNSVCALGIWFLSVMSFHEEPYDARVSSTVVRPEKVDISNGCKSHQNKSQSSVAK